MPSRRRVLLGQLAANGDCVYATTVARQIKADDPECHLTWAIGSACRQVIQHNPHVDEVWEIPLERREDTVSAWRAFECQAAERRRRGDFDDVYLTQIAPNNYKNFDGTVRASIFRGYPKPITVPITPVIRLSHDEIEGVRAFASQHRLTESGPVVLFECASLSGQSLVTLAWALDVSRIIVGRLPGTRVIMGSRVVGLGTNPAIIDASVLGFRQIAELTRYCSLFIGCSSGLTWLCTSEAAHTIPMIQVLTKGAGMLGAVVADLEYWGLPSGHVIEMRDCDVEHAASAALDVLTEGVASARPKYHEQQGVRLTQYYDAMLGLFWDGRFADLATSMRHTIGRYGMRKEFVTDLVRVLAARPGSWARRIARRRWH
jgi:hypothetical protein